MCVSFDAASSKTYKKIRGARFDLVTDGVKKLTDLGINVTTQMIVQYENYHEILQYRDLCLQLGVSFIGLQTIRRWKHMTDDWWRQNTIENNSNIDYDFLVQALREFKKTSNTGIDGGLENILFASANTIKLQIL
jgi:MoaA/NifB/PqqE/SkfB family radical SAM enzyme